MRTLEIFINDQFYKTISIDDDNGRYNPIEILRLINEDKEKGLLDELLIDGQFSIRMKLNN